MAAVVYSSAEVFRDANKVSLPVPAGTVSGTPVRIGSLNGVTATDRANLSGAPVNADGTLNYTGYNQGGGNADGNATVWLAGAFSVPVTAAAAPATGDPVYWDATAKKLTATVGTNALFGVVLAVGTNNSDGTYQSVVRLTN